MISLIRVFLPASVFLFLFHRGFRKQRFLELKMIAHGSPISIDLSHHPDFLVMRSASCRSTYINLDINKRFQESKGIVSEYVRFAKSIVLHSEHE